MKRICIIAALLTGILISATCFITPRPIETGNYSLAGTWKFLEEISSEPRPNGSDKNNKTRDDIMTTLKRNGINAEILTSDTTNYNGEKVDINNIYLDFGVKSKDSVLFIAHYDSAETSPGAGDNGMSVASLVQVLSKIPKDMEYKTNIKVLFTDAEELGLLGAYAFMEDNKERMADVLCVINLEGFGSGPVMLVESKGTDSIYLQSVDVPVGFSVLSSFPALLRFDTRPFLDNGYPIMTVATVTGSRNYHSPNDSFQHASINSQQHSLNTAYSLVISILNMDENELNSLISSSGKTVFFNIGYGVMLKYPSLIGIMIAVFVMVMIITYHMHRRRNVFNSLKSTMIGIFVVILFPILFYGIIFVLFRLTSFITWNSLIQIPFDRLGISLLSLLLLLIASFVLCFGVKKLIAKKEEFYLILLYTLGLIGVISSIALPGFAYLVYIPTLAITVSLFCKNSFVKLIPYFIVMLILYPILFLAITSTGATVITSVLFVFLLWMLLITFGLNERKENFMEGAK